MTNFRNTGIAGIGENLTASGTNMTNGTDERPSFNEEINKIKEGRTPYKLDSSESESRPTYNDFLEKQKTGSSKILVGKDEINMESKDEEEYKKLR